MQQAMDSIREALAYPTVKGCFAAAAALWAALVHQVIDVVFWTLAAVMVAYTLDGLLGVTVAWMTDEFDRSRLKRFVSKGLGYTAFAWIAFFAGALLQAMSGREGTGVAMVCLASANAALFVTEATSVLQHVNTLTDGKLGAAMPWLTRLIGRIRLGEGEEKPDVEAR